MYKGPSLQELREKAAKEQLQSAKKEGKVAVVAGMCGNIAVGLVKFVAAFISGSAAMFSEGIHSMVDSGNGMLMLFGMRQSQKKEDFLHPFGYGKELYFWTMLVALLIFFLGGGISILQGVMSIHDTMNGAHKMGSTTLNYVVVVIAMIIEGITLGIAIKQFNSARGTVGPIKFIKDTKDPSLYTVVLEDSAAELGLLVALISTILVDLTGNMYLDGAGSIVIGLLLVFVAIVLLSETKDLLVGEGMKHHSLDELRSIVEADERVMSCGRILTMYMGPHSLLIAIDVTFRPSLAAYDVLSCVDDLERRLSARWPQATAVFIEAESIRSVQEQKLEEADWEDEDAKDDEK